MASKLVTPLFFGLQTIPLMFLLVGCATAIDDREMVVNVTSVTASILLPDRELPIPSARDKILYKQSEAPSKLSPDKNVRIRVMMKALKQEAFDPLVLVRISDSNEGKVLREEKFDRLDFLKNFERGETVDVVLAHSSCRPLLVTVIIGLDKRGSDYQFPTLCRNGL